MLGFLVLIVTLAAQASSVGPVQPSPVERAHSEPISDHVKQLQKCREGLVDPQARPEERRRWAELLFSYQTAQAKALIIELLSDAQRRDVQRALCAVLGDQARTAPDRLDPDLVEPLMNLLGVEADDLRALAAAALADFPGVEVPAKLGLLASRKETPLVQRLAAIDALAPNTHRREVVAQLISLLDADTPQITSRVVAALESATPRTFGTDSLRWEKWWEEKARLSEEVWLGEQLRIYRDRSRRLADEFARYRSVTRREREVITGRMRTLQRELFRVLNSDQQEAKLAEWLGDPVAVVKLTAFSIVKGRIADEGKRPEGDVLVALLKAFREGTGRIRREALDIIKNLNDPAVVEAILSELPRENDPATRHAMFKAIGKLDRPEAIPALIQEIASANSSPECVREAAIALGSVAGKASGDERLKGAARPLKERYHAAAADDIDMRSALLTAMAGLGDPALSPELLDAVESDDAMILQPAIRGLLAVGEDSKLPRLRTLMGDADPLVRLAATEAVGRLGREDADLERLLTRLDPAIETNDLAREAAWRGFRRFLSSRSISDRIKAAERLRDLPKLEAEYLAELVDTLSTANGDQVQREAVLDRLAAVLVARNQYAEAVPHLRLLYDLRSDRSGVPAMECGLRLLDAMLRDPAASGLGDLIRQLAAGTGDATARTRIVDLVGSYLESDEASPDAERIRRLLPQLRSVPVDLLGEPWAKLLERVSASVEPSDKVPSPSSAPPGG